MFDKKAYRKQYYEKNKEKISIQNKKYRENNNEKIIKTQKEYHKNNKEKIAKQRKEHYKTNKEKLAIYKKQYYENNKEHVRAKSKKWREQNGEYARHKQINRNYGLSHEDWQKIYDNQDGKCVICGKIFIKTSNACVDHDHDTGKIRGLLCSNCNIGIGYFEDNPELLEKATKYLLKLG